MRFSAMLIVPILLSTSTSIAASEHDARQAVLELNNYIEGLRFSDECFGRSDSKALAPLSDRIEAARARVAAKYDQTALATDAGDTDYVCHRTGRQPEVSHEAIRREALRLVKKLEVEADH